MDEAMNISAPSTPKAVDNINAVDMHIASTVKKESPEEDGLKFGFSSPIHQPNFNLDNDQVEEGDDEEQESEEEEEKSFIDYLASNPQVSTKVIQEFCSLIPGFTPTQIKISGSYGHNITITVEGIGNVCIQIEDDNGILAIGMFDMKDHHGISLRGAELFPHQNLSTNIATKLFIVGCWFGWKLIQKSSNWQSHFREFTIKWTRYQFIFEFIQNSPFDLENFKYSKQLNSLMKGRLEELVTIPEALGDILQFNWNSVTEEELLATFINCDDINWNDATLNREYQDNYSATVAVDISRTSNQFSGKSGKSYNIDNILLNHLTKFQQVDDRFPHVDVDVPPPGFCTVCDRNFKSAEGLSKHKADRRTRCSRE